MVNLIIFRNYGHHSIIIIAYGSCEQEFMANSDGQISTQLLANADVTGQDGQASILFCNSVYMPYFSEWVFLFI